ncbi:MAG: DUF2062 domain-containing protein [Bacteroidales bacterium]|nr:DUF2062 domain-containing protein [Bacteroidales bacterium]
MLMGPKDCKDNLLVLGGIVIVPTYNNAGTIGEVMSSLIKYSEDILVVNDGCTDATAAILETFGFRSITMEEISAFPDRADGQEASAGRLPCRKAMLSHPRNMGKGVALKNALTAARMAGYRYAITIDADSQHFPQDIPAFVEAAMATPDALIVGSRNLESENMPGRNTFANRFSNFWFRLETGVRLDDTQCGFRMYPLGSADYSRWYYTSLYEFELEALVFASWAGTEVRNIPVRVYYPPQEERVSHFRPLRDFTRISVLNTLLVLVCLLWIWPRNILRKCTWKNIRRFLDENLLHVKDSNLKLVLSIWLGSFVGLMPFYGYQLVLAVFLAHLLALNKLVAGTFSAISIPPLIPFIVAGSYWSGCAVLGRPFELDFSSISFNGMAGVLTEYIIGGFLLAAAGSTACAAVFACLLKIFRRR